MERNHFKDLDGQRTLMKISLKATGFGDVKCI